MSFAITFHLLVFFFFLLRLLFSNFKCGLGDDFVDEEIFAVEDDAVEDDVDGDVDGEEDIVDEENEDGITDDMGSGLGSCNCLGSSGGAKDAWVDAE